MRLTIIPSDKLIAIDGLSFMGVSLPLIPDTIHALQWYQDHGEIEYKDTSCPNQTITSLPSWATECISIWEEIKYQYDNPSPPPPQTYADLRAKAYPPFTDYLDGIVKNDQAQIDKYIADCLAVKAKYPKD